MPEGKTGQQVMEQLQRRVEQLGAVKTGNYLVDCEIYQSKLSGGRYACIPIMCEIKVAN